jgi:ribosomal-protein-serine acetyltransferase
MLIATLGEQVELRMLEMRHVSEYHRLVCDNLDRLYWIAAMPTPEDSAKRIRAGLQRFVDGVGLDAGIFERGTLRGFAGLFHIDTGLQSAEIGYWIAKDAEGRGLATLSCRALLRYAFEELQLHRIELRCGSTNAASIAVAKRLGFRLEGRLREADRVRDQWDDFLIYGLLVHEW